MGEVVVQWCGKRELAVEASSSPLGYTVEDGKDMDKDIYLSIYTSRLTLTCIIFFMPTLRLGTCI